MRLRVAFGKTWAAIGHVWLAKDLAFWVSSTAVGGAVLGPLLLRLTTPLSTVDTIIVAAVSALIFGGLAFLIARWLAPNKVVHHNHIEHHESGFATATVTAEVVRASDRPIVAYRESLGLRDFDGSRVHKVRVEAQPVLAIKNCQLFVYVSDKETGEEETRIPISGNFDVRPGDQTTPYEFVAFPEGQT
ncbi:MAG: hypothetical protein JO208_09440, partial [Alphaproteobacteria bacterium]|nr:hypothetical protein [Alphaproteobacteria bacterium]